MFMFLQSFLDKKDMLQSWMISKQWMESDRKGDDYYKYTQTCLENSTWCRALKWVVDAVKPLYLVLRYVDIENLHIFWLQTKNDASHTCMEARLGQGSTHFSRFMSKVSQRVRNMETNMLMIERIKKATNVQYCSLLVYMLPAILIFLPPLSCSYCSISCYPLYAQL